MRHIKNEPSSYIQRADLAKSGAASPALKGEKKAAHAKKITRLIAKSGSFRVDLRGH